MKLSTRCRYATLALFDIAFHNEGEPTQVRQIAERQDIPARFLEQIFQDLKRAELVDGKRGRNGGYFLRRPPDQITLGDIMRATDGPIEVNFCQSEDGKPLHGACPKNSRCIPAVIWGELSCRIRQLYEDYTLADLVARAEEAGLSRGEPGYMYFI
ncbi:MAG: Rrf2 family transcriptional regulator [Myxococcales bacterium]|nr:Rrf2 family transcriptional regulator [Myxococcales bacterium]MCB9543082.1 Rrf2 family transcriptional regulator [Myxococcales bacterium]MCB9551616.1 Rrf2 family transcriptional regulator [Myxococcales bacterium]